MTSLPDRETVARIKRFLAGETPRAVWGLKSDFDPMREDVQAILSALFPLGEGSSSACTESERTGTPSPPSPGAEASCPVELTADFVRALPGGKLDDSEYEAIETALDRADAPCMDGARWLTLAERVAALSSEARSPQSEAEPSAGKEARDEPLPPSGSGLRASQSQPVLANGQSEAGGSASEDRS